MATKSKGLHVLWPTENDEAASSLEVDIVAVHGLNGDGFKTWTQTGQLWLRDFLPESIQSARIMTFSYNANLLGGTAKGRITDFAENLLAAVYVERLNPVEQNRPLVFVCHSMGGLVVKRALTIANLREDYHRIRDATKGIIFLGTPHRGSSKASFATIAVNIFAAFRVSSKISDAPAELKTFSDSIQDITTEFVDIANKYTIVSLFETKPMEPIGLIVEPWSAKMEHPAERHRIGLDAHHRDVCRFPNAGDENYKIVRKHVVALLLEASQQYGNADDSGRHNRLVLKSVADKKDRHPNVTGHEYTKWSRAGASLDAKKETPIYYIPNVAPIKFWGRDTILRNLHDHFSKRAIDTTPSFCLFGFGGVGKTQVALKYVHIHKKNYRAIFWLHADTEEKLLKDISSIVQRLCGSNSSSESTDSAAWDVFKNWLGDNQGWLLIFDNVVSPGLLHRYWPGAINGYGAVLVTSRNPGVADKQLIEESTEVDAFSPDDGCQYFLSLLSGADDEERELANSITELMGGLPLALSHMASYIENSCCSLKEFLELWETHQAQIVEDPETAFVTGYELTLATAWKLSLSSLEPQAAELIQILSLFDPDSIPESLLRSKTIHRFENAPEFLVKLGDYIKAFRNLRQNSLVSKKRRETVFSIHRLIQSQVRRQWDSSDWELSFGKALLCLRAVFPRQEKGQLMVELYDQCRQFTSHLISLERHYSKMMPVVDSTALIDFAEILAHCGFYLFERGLHDTAERVLQTAKGICEKILGKTPSMVTALVLNNLACLRTSAGRYQESVELGKEVMKHRSSILAPDDQELANCYHNYANDLSGIGDFESAIEYMEKSLWIRKNGPDATVQFLELCLGSYGRLFMEMKDIEKAEKFTLEALALHPKCGRQTAWTLATCYTNGNIHIAKGFWDEAEKVHAKCLIDRIQILGEGAVDCGNSYHKTGMLLARKEQYKEAVQNLEKALAIFQTSTAAEPGAQVRTQLKLASVLKAFSAKSPDLEKAKRAKRAESLRTEANEKRKEIPNHDASAPCETDEQFDLLLTSADDR